MARKLIILAREMGLKLEMGDVKVESLVPKDLAAGSSDEFLDGLIRYDAAMLQRYQAAKQAGKVLRFVGRITAQGEATVGVMELEQRHAFANIALTDNVVRFSTARYNNNPLIVQGPWRRPRSHRRLACSRTSCACPLTLEHRCERHKGNGLRAGLRGERRHRFRHPRFLGGRGGRSRAARAP